ncbi:MAG: hypothetical protein ACRDY1_05250 [Acidimicrobiales bacterium]
MVSNSIEIVEDCEEIDEIANGVELRLLRVEVLFHISLLCWSSSSSS